MDDGKIRKENEFPKPVASGLGKKLLSLAGNRIFGPETFENGGFPSQDRWKPRLGRKALLRKKVKVSRVIGSKERKGPHLQLCLGSGH